MILPWDKPIDASISNLYETNYIDVFVHGNNILSRSVVSSWFKRIVVIFRETNISMYPFVIFARQLYGLYGCVFHETKISMRSFVIFARQLYGYVCHETIIRICISRDNYTNMYFTRQIYRCVHSYETIRPMYSSMRQTCLRVHS